MTLQLRWEVTSFRANNEPLVEVMRPKDGNFAQSAGRVWDNLRSDGYLVEWDRTAGCYKVTKDGVLVQEWRVIRIDRIDHRKPKRQRRKF